MPDPARPSVSVDRPSSSICIIRRILISLIIRLRRINHLDINRCPGEFWSQMRLVDNEKYNFRNRRMFSIPRVKTNRFRACLHGGGVPQVGEVRCGRSPHLSCKHDQMKMRDYMDRRVTPPKRVTSPSWGPPPPCKQALRNSFIMHYADKQQL